MRIWHAIRLSISIPYYFTTEKYNLKSYVDGALLDNLPIKLFKPTNNVLGIMLIDDNPDIKIDSFDIFTLNIFKCLRKKSNDYYENYNIIKINTKEIGTLDFEIKQVDKNKLFNYGYENTNNYFLLLEKKIKLKID